MGVAVQANLVTLRVAESRRHGPASTSYDIDVPPPGVVAHFRETLVDPKRLAQYDDAELHLRLHEVWGQFCLMRWLFGEHDDTGGANPANVPDDAEMRCDAVIEAKLAEVHALLWRLRFEQRVRNGDCGDRFESDRTVAETIPLEAFGQPSGECTNAELLYAACEHAGMLAVLRWVTDRRRDWGDEDIMAVDPQPF